MLFVCSTILLWKKANTVSVTITNRTGRPITVEIIQAGNHRTHNTTSLSLEKSGIKVLKLHTRTLERSFVNISDATGIIGKFNRPLGGVGFFRSESYTIDDVFLKNVNKMEEFSNSSFQ